MVSLVSQLSKTATLTRARISATRARPIADDARSRFYLELAHLLDAGLSNDAALRSASRALALEPRAAVMRMAKRIAAGEALSVAGRGAGLLPPSDGALLAAAERAGQVSPLVAYLSRTYEGRYRRHCAMRARLAFPAAVLALAAFLLPLPGVISGDLGLLSYSARVATPLMAMGLIVWALRRWQRAAQVAELPNFFSQAAAALPVLKSWLLMRSRLELLQAFGMLLTAGVPAADALAASIDCVANTSLKARFAEADARLARGASVAEALRHGECLDTSADFPIVSAGEAAGRLDAALNQCAERYRERLDALSDTAATWLPRIAYLAVASIVAGGIFG